MCKISFDDLLKEAQALEEQQNGKQVAIRPIKLAGLNGKIMRKNAMYMKMVAQDFLGILPTSFVVDKSKSSAKMSTSLLGEITINYDSFKASTKANRSYYHYGNYAFSTANSNYTGVHEYGHIVNGKLIAKIYGNNDFTRNDSTITDWNKNTMAAALIADCLIELAKSDDTIKTTLTTALEKPQNHDLTSSLAEIKKLLSNDNEKDVGGGKKRNSLLWELHQKGYISDYGAKDSGEFFAELFKDHYWYMGKKANWSDSKFNPNSTRRKSLEQKIGNSPGTYDLSKLLFLNVYQPSDLINPLSKLIVEKSQSLWNDEVEMDWFRYRHGYTTKQPTTTVKPKQQSLTSKGGLTK